MNLIDRVKNILLTPKTEWDVIDGETATQQSLLTGYVLPLALVAAIGSILKVTLFAGVYSFGIKYMLIAAIIAFVTALVGYYLTVFVVDMLAPNFGSEKDLGKSAQLVAYSSTPGYIAGLLSFIPVIGPLIALAGMVYGIYLMYLGIGPIKKTPEDKKVIYIIVAYAIMIAIGFVIAAVLGAVMYGSMGYSSINRFGL